MHAMCLSQDRFSFPNVHAIPLTPSTQVVNAFLDVLIARPLEDINGRSLLMFTIARNCSQAVIRKTIIPSTGTLFSITMTAQRQCDQPHVLFEHQRSSPADALCHWSEDLGEIDTQHASCSKLPRQSISDFTSPDAPQIKQEPTLGSPFALSMQLPLAAAQPSAAAEPSNSPWPTDISSSIMYGTSADHPASSLLLQNHDDRITSLERTVCSNFVCCGVHLPDFHALIDHFEENHVSVVMPSGKKIYPPQGFRSQSLRPRQRRSSNSPAPQRPEPPKIDTDVSSPSPCPSAIESTASTPASSRSSSVVSSPPMPATPLSPPEQSFDSVTIVSHDPPPLVEYNPYLGLAISIVQPPVPSPLSPFSLDVISAFGPEYDFSRDYACYETACFEIRRREEEAELERQRQLQLLDEAQRGQESLSESQDSPDELDLFAVDIPQSTSAYRKKVSKTRKEGSPAVDAASSDGGKVVKPKAKPAAGSGPLGQAAGVGRKREKAYKCPHHGCTKAYLNPNGLKYHLEKGTCKFEEGFDSSSPSPSRTASNLPASSNQEVSRPAPPPEPTPVVDAPPKVESPPSPELTSPPLAPTSFVYQYSTPPMSASSSSPTVAAPPTQPTSYSTYTYPQQPSTSTQPHHHQQSSHAEDPSSPMSPSTPMERHVDSSRSAGVPPPQDELTQNSKFTVAYEQHLQSHHPMARAQVVYNSAPPSSSL
ncbi:hypothetical protein CC2G_007803 [Coprinopsis cinerea AmutBmut pab1-1]|nr:hypothetical protein CC2G_007803 [Coprinopsis cinerea AmutBmut pab1-1]